MILRSYCSAESAAVRIALRFSYTITHDLRAPLRAINGYMDLLKVEKPQLSEVGQRHLSRIAAVAERTERGGIHYQA